MARGYVVAMCSTVAIWIEASYPCRLVPWLPSHSCPIDINELCVRPGRIWAWRPCSGTCGKFSSHATLFDFSCCPFGRPTIIGVVIPAIILWGSDGKI